MHLSVCLAALGGGPEIVERAWCGWVGLWLRIGQV
jgi:hypothetical protein